VKKNKAGDKGEKQHKGSKNAQPLIDHWGNFSRHYDYDDFLVSCKF